MTAMMGESPIISSLCLGFFLGGPLIIWGLVLRDRDRTWEIQRRQADLKGIALRRTPEWDQRQIRYSSLFLAAGAVITVIVFGLSVALLNAAAGA